MPDHGDGLEAQNTKGGISRVAPQQPKPLVHSLPPILSEISQTPISSCSKGSRGLSVLPRVLGIFTETLISPSPSLRQRPSRCAIRAGRNLPDKEFRYLRHVCYPSVTVTEWPGRLSSAWLSASPRRSDHLFALAHRASGVWPLRILSRMSSNGSRRCLPPTFIE
jgi:hypothetical protein